MLILTLFNTLKFISLPPSNKIYADQNVSIRLFSTGKDCIFTIFSTDRPISIPAIKYSITSGIFRISLSLPKTIPVTPIIKLNYL